LAAVGVAVAGGLALSALVPERPRFGGPTGAPSADAMVRVHEAVGSVRVEREEGWGVALANGDHLPRPAPIITVGAAARVTLGFGAAVARLGQEAHVLVAERAPHLLLESGRLVAVRPSPLGVDVPAHVLSVEGCALAVSVEGDDGARVGVPGGEEVEIVWRGTARTVEGPSLVVVGSELERFSLPERLEVEMEDVVRRGRGTRVVGRTAPRAEVSLRLGEAEARAFADGDGRFRLEVPARGGALAIEARDVFGRVARPQAPSPPLEALLGELAALEPALRAVHPRARGVRATDRPGEGGAMRGVADAPAPSPRPKRTPGARRAAGTPGEAPARPRPEGSGASEGAPPAAAETLRPATAVEIPPPAPPAAPGASRRSATPGPVRLEIRGEGRPVPPPLEKEEVAPSLQR
jgi:hypothetical protein